MGVQEAAMVKWLHCPIRIHKILCSNLGIIIDEMILDKSLTAKLSRMTHSHRASVSTLEGKGCKYRRPLKGKDGKNWLLVDPNDNRSRPQLAISPWEVIIILINGCTILPLSIYLVILHVVILECSLLSILRVIPNLLCFYMLLTK